MLRTFAEHHVRYADDLGGFWDFVTEPERKDRGRLPRTYNRRIFVPSAWERLPGLENYRGRAWLRTTFSAVADRAARLVFGGVSHTGTVFVDGKKVGGHDDAFTPWEVLLTGLAEGPHELVVEVDNSFGPHAALHIENDYYTYGGITRPAEVQHLDAVYVRRMHARPFRTRAGWSLDVRLTVANWSRRAAARRLVLLLGDVTLDGGAVRLAPGATRELTLAFDGLDVEAWSAASPRLYQLEALLLDGERIADDLVDRVGFREVRVRGRAVLLNGAPVKFRGYNRHEDHALYGNALPLEAMVADLQILRDLHCNFVRTSHYPNDRRFLDLCDELGFYVWEESHARTVDFKHPRFREQIERSTDEMVNWHYNHPSIVMWGCLNECDSISPEGRAEHARVIAQLRRLDPHRPITFASNKGTRDRCLDLVDIVSWNVYTGWYRGRPGDTAAELKKLLAWKESSASGARGKPLIMSEFGGGALPGYRNPNRNHWSEEFLMDVLDDNLGVYLNHPRICGVAIWQFCDCRVTHGDARWNNRPRTMNNKGTVDECRRPKLVYDVVKRHMIAAETAERRARANRAKKG